MTHSSYRKLPALATNPTTPLINIAGNVLSIDTVTGARPHGALGAASCAVGSMRAAIAPLSRPLPHLTNRMTLPTRELRSVVPLAAPRRYPVASIDFSRPDVTLPYGTPKHVNAATLKALAGGQRFDRLLRKAGDRWEFVADDTMIDLSDGSVQFKLGQLAIFS